MKAFVVVGMGFGDEGKGSIVDYLTRLHKASEVVRFNGGAQAAHNVVTPGVPRAGIPGHHHTFAQFGSGALAGARTYLASAMMVNPISLFTESRALNSLEPDCLSRLTISADAPVTTPYHIAANRLREIARGDKRHGSCGMGIGETQSDIAKGYVLPMSALLDLPRLRNWLRMFQDVKRDQLEQDGIPCPPFRDKIEDIVDLYRFIAKHVKIEAPEDHVWPETVIFEGAQGILLDQDWGFAPYNSWSKCGFEEAHDLVPASAEIQNIGVIRAYMTRHGPGPFPTEDKALDLPDEYNDYGPWQGEFRVGWPDLMLLRYAIGRSKPDVLAVTNLDRMPQKQICTSYTYRGEPVKEISLHGLRGAQRMGKMEPVYQKLAVDLCSYLEAELGIDVAIRSNGPTWKDKR